ncbi:MAG: hypothetical protein QM775_02495 [Pirellulales bacterium]
MRKCFETVVCLALVLVVGGAWLVAPFAVVSGSMSPTLVGPHRQFRCEECGERNVMPVEIPLFGGRRGVCRKCGKLGPVLNTLAITPGDRMLVDYTAAVSRTAALGDRRPATAARGRQGGGEARGRPPRRDDRAARRPSLRERRRRAEAGRRRRHRL